MRTRIFEKNIHIKTDNGRNFYLVKISIKAKHFSKSFPFSEKGLKDAREYLAWLKTEKERITNNFEFRNKGSQFVENNELSNYEKHFHKLCIDRGVYALHA